MLIAAIDLLVMRRSHGRPTTDDPGPSLAKQRADAVAQLVDRPPLATSTRLGLATDMAPLEPIAYQQTGHAITDQLVLRCATCHHIRRGWRGRAENRSVSATQRRAGA